MLETLATLLVFGTIWFWVIVTLLCAVAVVFLDHLERDGEEGFGALIALSLFSAALFYFCGQLKAVVIAAFANPILTLEFVAGYFVIGLIYSFIKWYLYLRNIKEKYITFKVNWIRNHLAKERWTEITNWSNPPVPEDMKQDWEEELKFQTLIQMFVRGEILASEHKVRITAWIAWWPISSFWTLLNDPIKKIANYLFSQFKEIYNKIYRAMIGNITSDLLPPDAPREVRPVERRR